MSDDTVATQYRPPQDVGSQRLAAVYAEALLGAAGDSAAGDNVLAELDSLVTDVFQNDPSLEEFFASPVVPAHVKETAIDRICDGRASDLFRDFLKVLNHHGRLELVRLVAQGLRHLIDDRARRIRVLVRTAVPLADDQRQRLTQFIHDALNLEPVLDLKVDPALLGGLVVRVLDWQFDGSVRSRLQTIRNQIIESSSHEIQSGRDRFRSEA
jgi:F-type H+-transporting ATPase subunit delta